MEAKTYLVSCSCSNEYATCPSAAEFTIEEGTAREIARLSAFVKENKLHTVEKFDYRASWLKVDPAEIKDLREAGEAVDEDDNEMRTECDILCISNDEFWFRCYEKHCGHLITTDRQNIAELLEHFELKPETDASAAA